MKIELGSLILNMCRTVQNLGVTFDNAFTFDTQVSFWQK